MKTKNNPKKEEIRESVKIYRGFLQEYMMRIYEKRIADGKSKINFEKNTIQNINN